MKRKNKDSFTDLEKKYYTMALDFYLGRIQGIPPDTAMADILQFGNIQQRKERIKIFVENNICYQVDNSIKSLNDQKKEINEYLK